MSNTETSGNIRPRRMVKPRRLTNKSLDDRQLLTYREACIILGLGETKVRELIEAGKLRRMKIGAAARITRASLDAFIAEISA